MPTIVERAAKGNKKSMIALYEANKKSVYSFCRILLEDEQESETAVVQIFNEAWDKLDSMGVTTESEYRYMLMLFAAKYCRNIIFGKQLDGFKVTKIPPHSVFYPNESVFDGDIPKGMEELKAALSELSKEQRFVYLLWAAGGLGFKEIVKIINQRETLVKYFFCTAFDAALEDLKNSNSDLKAEQIKSLVKKCENTVELPNTAEKNCTDEINNRAKKTLIPKKVWLPAVAVVLLVAGAVTFFAIGGSKKNNKDDATSLNSAVAFDTSLTYYADIDIQDYGTVTVKLDQSAAPITVENFVNLANSGFYDGLTFHRIIEGFMMQGGDPKGNGTGGSENTIVGEFSNNGYENKLSHTRGTISMARSNDYDSASSQFFIMHKDGTHLDGDYAAFGSVIEGMDIVDRICESAEPTDGNGTIIPEEQPVINTITIRTAG